MACHESAIHLDLCAGCASKLAMLQCVLPGSRGY